METVESHTRIALLESLSLLGLSAGRGLSACMYAARDTSLRCESFFIKHLEFTRFLAWYLDNNPLPIAADNKLSVLELLHTRAIYKRRIMTDGQAVLSY